MSEKTFASVTGLFDQSMKLDKISLVLTLACVHRINYLVFYNIK